MSNPVTREVVNRYQELLSTCDPDFFLRLTGSSVETCLKIAQAAQSALKPKEISLLHQQITGYFSENIWSAGDKPISNIPPPSCPQDAIKNLFKVLQPGSPLLPYDLSWITIRRCFEPESMNLDDVEEKWKNVSKSDRFWRKIARWVGYTPPPSLVPGTLYKKVISHIKDTKFEFTKLDMVKWKLVCDIIVVWNRVIRSCGQDLPPVQEGKTRPAIYDLAKNFPKWIDQNMQGQLAHLTELDLSHAMLTRVPPEIGRLTTLKGLNLSSNRLLQVPAEIGNLPQLSQLDLSFNSLSFLPPMSGLSSLEALNLSNNPLGRVPATIGHLTSLRSLSLSNTGLQDWPSEINSLNSLRFLDLSSNQLSQISPKIRNLTHLANLQLGTNQLREIPSEIGLLRDLNTLTLWGNKNITSLPDTIWWLTNLETLDISQLALPWLSEKIGKLVQLRKLSVIGNSLKNIPENIASCQLLTTLTFRQNELTSVPNSLWNLKNLQSLDLGDNRLAELPPGISDLPNLEYLSLEMNQLDEDEEITSLQDDGVEVIL